MNAKKTRPALFTKSVTLEDLISGKDLGSKCISAKVLKEYIDYRLNSNNMIPGSSVGGGQMVEEDGEF